MAKKLGGVAGVLGGLTSYREESAPPSITPPPEAVPEPEASPAEPEPEPTGARRPGPSRSRTVARSKRRGRGEGRGPAPEIPEAGGRSGRGQEEGGPRDPGWPRSSTRRR